MAKQPEDRAIELMAEMSALIDVTERQVEQSREMRKAMGLDDAALERMVRDVPADKKAEMQAAIDQDLREIEEDVAQAKLAVAHAAPAAGAKRPRMRPMI